MECGGHVDTHQNAISCGCAHTCTCVALIHQHGPDCLNVPSDENVICGIKHDDRPNYIHFVNFTDFSSCICVSGLFFEV